MKNRRRKVTIYVFVIFSLIFNFPVITKAEERPCKPSFVKRIFKKDNGLKLVDIYYIPHPDDETLSMGAAIAGSIYSGNEVHLVLLSQGYDSSSTDKINGRMYCNLHKKYHKPEVEGYKTLTRYKLGELRLREFLNASADLGVKRRNIHICNFHDGKFKEKDIRELVLSYNEKYHNAVHNTTSYYDSQRTHRKMAITLYILYHEGKIKNARFFISPYNWENANGVIYENPKINKRVIKSISDYGKWNPQESYYAIGYHSVEALFKLVRKHLISKYYIACINISRLRWLMI